MVPRRKIILVAKDKEFRTHSKSALCSASKAVARARKVDKPSKTGKLVVLAASAIVLGSVAIWAKQSLGK